ncbi:aldo/keto reductase [Candidatus Bathyarchaeota archaeon]|nr:aldo/keto reductase [Candidatus Bathyarchaeota archaeon]
MEFKRLDDGVEIPVLGLGTWTMGGSHSADRSLDNLWVSVIRSAIELGFTHIDTAEMYGGGHCEEIVGEAVEPFRRRDLFITTKVWKDHLKHDDLKNALRGSLRRLGVEYVDLYLIHWPNPAIPLKETMTALEESAREGLTRFIGVSNFSAALMDEAQSYLKDERLIANQVEYSLKHQSPRGELLPYCIRNNVTLIAYTPLAKGDLARWGHNVLDEMAEKYGKTPSQVSLNWLISQDRVVAIPKASKLEHLKDNLGAIGWRLSREDHEKLTKAFKKSTTE